MRAFFPASRQAGSGCFKMPLMMTVPPGAVAWAYMIYVEDADASLAQAVAAGATVLRPVSDQFWGDRSGQVLDPYGYKGSLATPKEVVTPEEIQRRAASFAP